MNKITLVASKLDPIFDGSTVHLLSIDIYTPAGRTSYRTIVRQFDRTIFYRANLTDRIYI